MKEAIKLILQIRLIKFLFSGVINTVITYIIYLTLLKLLSYQLSYTIAFIFGIAIAFFLNHTFVFNANKSWKSIAIFPLVYLFQYFFGVLVLWFFISFLGLDPKLGPIVVAILSLPFTYWLCSFIFVESK